MSFPRVRSKNFSFARSSPEAPPPPVGYVVLLALRRLKSLIGQGLVR